jgi:glucose dehydrogenase
VDWPLVGGDWGNTRYSTLARINASNVKTLKGAWMTRLQS